VKYYVQPGDSLWFIAESQLGDGNRWTEIVRANGLLPPYNLLIGQELSLPSPITDGQAGPPAVPQFRPPRRPPPIIVPQVSQDPSGPHKPAWVIAARGSLFVILREFAPNGKLVRKVLSLPYATTAATIVNFPDQFGFHPRNMNGLVTLGEHALGNTMSRFISASAKPFGAPNFPGTPWYIDIAKAESGGAIIHSTEEIIRDLDRIAATTTNQGLLQRIARLKSVIDSVEGEVLIEGSVRASAVQSAEAAANELKIFKALGRTGKVITVVGVVFTAYDLEQASVRSIKSGSIRPIAAETVRQGMGWGGGFLGGFALGAALGIETGPGAILTGLVGGIIGGIAGFWGGNLLAEKIDLGH
jgi:outer membrane lipoprotein SlyB